MHRSDYMLDAPSGKFLQVGWWGGVGWGGEGGGGVGWRGEVDGWWGGVGWEFSSFVKRHERRMTRHVSPYLRYGTVILV